MPKKPRRNLSKSLFIKGMQCLKALWLTKHHPELASKKSRPWLLTEGQRVGQLAQGLFPQGKAIDRMTDAFPLRLWLTKKLIAQQHSALFEATVQWDSITIMADILVKTDAGWELWEVKSSTSPHRSHYVLDLAVQSYVCKQAGIPIDKVKLVTLNPQYKRQGDLDLWQLFVVTDLTEEVECKEKDVSNEIIIMRQSIQEEHMPSIGIGVQCHSPYECEFKSTCWAGVSGDSVLHLKGVSWNKKFQLLQEGIAHLADIDSHHPLYRHPQVMVHRMQEPILKRESVQAFISQLVYPLSFLDFEAFQMAIPLFEGLVPFEQIPFEFSLHVVQEPLEEAIHTVHLEMPSDRDSRFGLAQALAHVLPPSGSILVYDSGYERIVLRQLAKLCPQYAPLFEGACDRLVDLMVPFGNYWVVHEAMHGGVSIKAILPALFPGQHYQELAIQDGEMVRGMYDTLLHGQEPDVKHHIVEQLKDYCQMDTLAMVKILAYLKTL